MNTPILNMLGFLVLSFMLAACGGAESAPESGAAPASSAAVEVRIQPVGNKMEYAQKEFTVEAGQTVHLVFENTATSPAMQHNVVVLTTMDEAVIMRVGQKALEAGAARDYLPEDEAILAHTPLSAPGETVEVTFTAPSEPGDYRYICTFPGHYMVMQGTMHVGS